MNRPPDRFAGARAVSRSSIVEPTAADLDAFERSLRRLGATDAVVETILGHQRERLREAGELREALDQALQERDQIRQRAKSEARWARALTDELAHVREEHDHLRAEIARLQDDPTCPEGHEFAPVEAVGEVTCCRQCGAWFRVLEKGYVDPLPPLPRIVAQLDEARAQRDEARRLARWLYEHGGQDVLDASGGGDTSEWRPWLEEQP